MIKAQSKGNRDYKIHLLLSWIWTLDLELMIEHYNSNKNISYANFGPLLLLLLLFLIFFIIVNFLFLDLS